MAKCVKDHKSGKIFRCSDEDAASHVKTGRYSYAPKSEYKAQLAKA